MILENSEDGKSKFYNSTKENRKIKYKNNLNMNNKDNKNNYSSIKVSDSKKNEINDITLMKKQNNSIKEKENNLVINPNSNVTNNVCIIINNTDKRESKDDINNKNIINNISFSNVDNINEDNKRNKYIKITDNVSDSDSTNIKQNFTDNNIDNYYNPLVRNENDNKTKINNEINYIKMTIASKLIQENTQLLQQKDNVEPNNLNEIVKANNNSKEIENNNKYSCREDKIKDSSFENKSLKNILNIKHKELKYFEKEIEKKKTIQIKRHKIGIREKLYPNIKTDNNNDNGNENKKEKLKKLDKRSYSKPVNTIRVKNKDFKTFNHNNLNKMLDKNKTYREKKINKKAKNEIKVNEFNNLSIDSNEIILSDANVNTFLERMKSTKKIKDKPINAIYYKKNKIFKKKNQRNGEEIFYDCDSTSNPINNTNLTFNKSIEKKRHLLGLPINVKLNSNLKKKISGANRTKDKITKKGNKNKIWKSFGKKEEKNLNNNNKINKPLKILFNKRQKNSINKHIKSTIATKKQNKNYNFYSLQKSDDYDKETYSNYNFDSNSVDTSSQLFKSKLNNMKKDKIKDNTTYIAFNNSLSSTFSSKTNKTSLTNNIVDYKFKNKDFSHTNKSKYNLSNYNQFKNNINSKGYIFVTKNENKDFLSTIRLVKKRVKYINKMNQIEEGEKKEDVIMNVNTENIKSKSKEKNNLNQTKELAVIRRINKIKERYKNKGNQITDINKKYQNIFNIDLNNSNICNNNKKKAYQFQSYRRLSQIHKNHKYSFSNSGSFYMIKSKSNKSFLNENKSLESFKI